MFTTKSRLNNFSNISKIYLQNSIRQKSVNTTQHPNLVRPITVRTCVNLYPKLRELFPGQYPRKAPVEGLDLTVDYADTALESPQKAFDKTILAIHGNPGYLHHFNQLISHYRGSRVRVIVPNLPDFSHTRSSGNIFWHSTPEKVAFVKDFLGKIGVDKIDCLIGHSFGIQTVGGLLDEVRFL